MLNNGNDNENRDIKIHRSLMRRLVCILSQNVHLHFCSTMCSFLYGLEECESLLTKENTNFHLSSGVFQVFNTK